MPQHEGFFLRTIPSPGLSSMERCTVAEIGFERTHSVFSQHRTMRIVMRTKCKVMLLIGLAAILIPLQEAAAQGLPVDTGSHIPVALMFIGAAVLGIGMVYGIMRNRKRTPAEKRVTEQATKAQYSAGERETS
jgi:hypothetical protein